MYVSALPQPLQVDLLGSARQSMLHSPLAGFLHQSQPGPDIVLTADVSLLAGS